MAWQDFVKLAQAGIPFGVKIERQGEFLTKMIILTALNEEKGNGKWGCRRPFNRLHMSIAQN